MTNISSISVRLIYIYILYNYDIIVTCIGREHVLYNTYYRGEIPTVPVPAV